MNTTDLPPMEPCPVGPKGRHAIDCIIPSKDEGDLTLFCERCGAIRRLPAMGALPLPPLDDIPAAFRQVEQ